MFKLVFSILGFLSLSVLGAVIGFFIGSSLDRHLAYGSGAVNPFTTGRRQAIFLETVFSLMGKLAKADGRITQDEISHAERIMSQLGVKDYHREDAIRFFRAGSKDDYSIEPILNEFISVCGFTHNLKQVLLSYLITIALADGVLHPAEQQLLGRIALALGYSEQDFERLLSMIQAQSHFSGGQVPTTSALQEAYMALGVTESQSDQEIKKAYRKLMSQNHPDKLMGQGLPEDMVKAATEQAKEIQTAYDLIMKSRKR